MFTGIISWVYKITVSGHTVIVYATIDFCKLVKIGDSVAINGICLTVTEILENKLVFHITEETISKTNIFQSSESESDRMANVELAVKYGDHLGGHLILGHVHTTGNIISLDENGNLWIEIPESFLNCIKYKGSIAINGVSLTIAEIIDNKIRIALIPETIKRTIPMKEGDIVNVEFDTSFINDIQDTDFMTMAIEEGEKGRSTAPPNPWVGCVIVKDGKEISRGYHHRAGEPHAEINAIDNAKGKNLEGSTMYVTLEPCCMFPGKRTGACVDRIIQERISTVIIGTRDPNPHVMNKGAEILEKAGIRVLFQEDINKKIYDNVCFSLRQYIHYRKTGIPYITAKIALTIDNCYATSSNSDRWITHAGSREELYKIWNESQAIIIGAGTVETDTPELNQNDSKSLNNNNDSNDDHDHQNNFKKIIIDGDCLQNLDQKIFSDDMTYVVTSNPDKWEGIDVKLIYVTDTYDIKDVIENISKELPDVMQCIVEGGGILHRSFFEEKFVNELLIFRGPKIYGDEGIKWSMPYMNNIHLYETKLINYNGSNNVLERYIVL